MSTRTSFVLPKPALCLTIVMVAGYLPAASAPGAAAESPPAVLSVPAERTTIHLAVPLPGGVRRDASAAWWLVEVDRPEVEVERPEVKIPAQQVPATAADGTVDEKGARLAANVPPREGAAGVRRFRLEAMPAGTAKEKAGFRFRDVDENSLGLWDGDRPVLVYNHGVITDAKIPEKDTRRSRACYVHPLYGLNGEVLTDDFPKDHYHHHGIFWSWPHVGIDGREYDLWVYNNIQQKFVRWICRETGPVAAVLGVENGWFVGTKKVMIERVWLRAYRAAGGERSLDLEFAWVPVDRPITLRGAEGKSYGGLNLRYAVRKEKETVITVPSGRTKEDLPDTPLAWADLSARFAGAAGRSGAAIFVDPAHPDFPPTWLTRHYGILCVGWPGVKARTFAPGTAIRLNYRVWIHKADAELDQLTQAFAGYGAGTKARWEVADNP